MANALTDFTKKREFLVCMDSDGCVMNTVRIKHTTVMCRSLSVFLRWMSRRILSLLHGTKSTCTRSPAESPGLRVCGWCLTG